MSMMKLAVSAHPFQWTKRLLTAWILAVLTIGLSAPAFAGGEASIKLAFTNSDKIYLYVSLGFGLIAVLFGYYFYQKLNRLSPGDEKMQEVGTAIREGALAYLAQQRKLMAGFVLVIALGLGAMYWSEYGPTLAIGVAACFVLGVVASYSAGFIGMKMAVNGNTRTAHAALTSYKSALETAFQSGAVAGLFTVGLGLIGATLIFLAAPSDATKLLIGFGFGGSLAALFMRVGGGIYTKAADVGADLVGKVEAGIPEDDPRNPAVIADNVGDNVGDCAGMAADVFESYEVTLVAAIVLGAATASLFDQSTWMKLILFALMARGVGIIASIIGIFMVKGSDDLNSDPLKSIKRGFSSSAVIAVIMTAILAFLMMGGQGSTIVAKRLVPKEQTQLDEATAIQAIRAKLAKKDGKTVEEIQPTDIQADPDFAKLGLTKEEAPQVIGQTPPKADELGPRIPDVSGYSPVDLSASDNPLTKLSGIIPGEKPGDEPSVKPASELFKDGIFYYNLSIEQSIPKFNKDGKADGMEKKAQAFAGVMSKSVFDAQMKVVKGQGTIVNVVDQVPVTVFYDKSGKVILGIDAKDGKMIAAHRARPVGLYLFAVPAKDLLAKLADQKKNPTAKMPDQTKIDVGITKSTTVPWYMFLACIFFGVLMAFAFEMLTDYYVSLHKRPVRELGDLATAGPAPMIITGFAYGLESSVFSVFAIVLALIMPVFFFPVQVYGSYILSFYGIALVGLGLLTTTGFILAMDTFGPISDNAQGVFEMSGAAHTDPEGARRVQLLDAAGNTTKALTKGFAIATAVVAAVALFHAYVEQGMLTVVGMRLEVPEIFLGLLIGGAAPYLFSAFSINAVGRAAFELINEVRSQFRNDPGIMLGTSKPDYAKCVVIVTAAAQRELLGPGILAIAFPVLVAFGFAIGKPTTMIGGVEYNLVGAQALGGFLAGSILSGQLMAVLLANSGGMWDNAKKLIEDGLHGGKGTEAHKAAIVCDTVGDPFKDTAGPALNPLIKVMNLVALLLAPTVIKPWGVGVQVSVTLIAAGLLAFAVYLSKKGSLSSGMNAVAKANEEEAK